MKAAADFFDMSALAADAGGGVGRAHARVAY